MSRAPKQPATPPSHAQGARGQSAPPVLERMGTATLGPVFTLPLDQIALAPEVYRHRAQADLEPKKVALKELADNLIVEGQRDPLVVYKDEHPTDPARPYILIAGHRRHAALLLLCDKNTPGFARDMPVTARAIEGGSKADYLLLSVSDNLFHEPLDSHHLILAAVALLKVGCSHTRIKVNLRLSDSTFARCLRLHESQWMITHIEKGDLGLSDVHSLLEAAGGKGGASALEHLRSDLASFFAAVRVQIDAKAENLAEQGKELKGAANLVKTYLPRHLLQSWILLLKRGERIRSHAKYRYGAAIIQERLGKRVQIPAMSVPLVEGELDKLAEITIRLDQLVKQLRPQLLVLAQSRASAAHIGNGDDSISEYEAAGLAEVAKILYSLNLGEGGPRRKSSPSTSKSQHTDAATPDDDDREATQYEANQNWEDQEEKERKLKDIPTIVEEMVKQVQDTNDEDE